MGPSRGGAITLHQLRILAAVARARSFAGGAERLSLSQPAVSLQVKRLEALLGRRLFERSPGRSAVELTDTGRILFQACIGILDELDSALAEVEAAGGRKPKVVVLGSDLYFGGYVFPQLVERLQESLEAVTIHLEVDRTPRVLERLRDQHVDVAVLVGPSDESDLESVPWGTFHLVFVGPPGHRLAGETRAPFRKLARERLILPPPGVYSRARLDQLAAEKGIRLNVILEADSVEARINAVARGIGIALLPGPSIHEDIRRGHVALLHVEGMPIRAQWFVIHRRSDLRLQTRLLKERLLECAPRLGSALLVAGPELHEHVRENDSIEQGRK
jgi:DNA-binding transcriptional LysR family regulator